MNARSRFSQSAISNGHTGCWLLTKSVAREKNLFLAHSKDYKYKENVIYMR